MPIVFSLMPGDERERVAMASRRATAPARMSLLGAWGSSTRISIASRSGSSWKNLRMAASVSWSVCSRNSSARWSGGTLRFHGWTSRVRHSTCTWVESLLRSNTSLRMKPRGPTASAFVTMRRKRFMCLLAGGGGARTAVESSGGRPGADRGRAPHEGATARTPAVRWWLRIRGTGEVLARLLGHAETEVELAQRAAGREALGIERYRSLQMLEAA